MQHDLCQSYKKKEVKFAVAPMLDWTDRHCRFFHRLLTKKALLYTEMYVANAVIFGKRKELLSFSKEEHPIAIQIGGENSKILQEAAIICQDFGYDEINLNVGCPSDRVKAGAFGACLMYTPEKVAEAVEKIKSAVSVPVTVKCRIGVDQQDVEESLDNLGSLCIKAGVSGFWVHARKAWLKGLSPKENRDIPPLDYPRVYRFKEKNPEIFIGINGAIKSLDEAENHLNFVDAAMLGRQAYQNPLILREVDKMFYKDKTQTINFEELIHTMIDYAFVHIEKGGSLGQVTRHMIGLFHGYKGAKKWRQILSVRAAERDADPEILRDAFKEIIFEES